MNKKLYFLSYFLLTICAFSQRNIDYTEISNYNDIDTPIIVYGVENSTTDKSFDIQKIRTKKHVADSWSRYLNENGYIRIDGASYITGSGPVNPNTGDFSIGWYMKSDDYTPSATSQILSSATAGTRFNISLLTTGLIQITTVFPSVNYSLTPSSLFVNGNEYIVVLTFNRDGNATLYTYDLTDLDVWGENGTRLFSDAIGVDFSATGGYSWCNDTDTTFEKFRPLFALNGVMSLSEIDNYVQNVELPEWADNILTESQDSITSGSLVSGNWYIIETYQSGDDFTNIGAATNADGIIFQATGTTPAVWTNSSSLRLSGDLLSYQRVIGAGQIISNSGISGSIISADVYPKSAFDRGRLYAPNLILDFGASGNGTIDDTSALQNAIDYCIEYNKPLYVPSGTYSISSVSINDAIEIIGESNGTVDNSSTKTNGSVLFVANTANATMFDIQADDVGYIVKGLKISNISIDGNNIAYNGIEASTLYYSEFRNIIIRRMAGTDYGFILDDGNQNLSLHNLIENVHYSAGANAAAADSGGFLIASTNASGGGCVQNKFVNCSASTVDGDAWYMNGSDNNMFYGIYSYVSGTGAGFTLANDGVGPTPARNNYFDNAITPFIAKTGTYGNVISSASSEVLEITAETDSQLHYSVLDYAESSIYDTHHYSITDYYSVGIGGTEVVGSASKAVALSLWSGILMQDASSDGVIFNTPANYKWKNGKVIGIELSYICTSANSSANVVFEVKAEPIINNSSAATPDLNQTYTISINNSANVSTIQEIDLGANAISIGSSTQRGIMWRITRLGANASDTCANSIYLTGIRLKYQYDGPINGQSTDITLPYKDF